MALTAVPDRRKHLPDGVLIQGSVRARIIGMQILTLDTTIVLTPAEVSDPARGAGPTARPARSRSAGPTPDRFRVPDHRLGEAIRCLDESAALLAASSVGPYIMNSTDYGRELDTRRS